MVSGPLLRRRTEAELRFYVGNKAIHIFGLNTNAGRLGVASFDNVHSPYKLPPLLRNVDQPDLDVQNIVMGRETCMIHVIDYSKQ